jgi:aryl-phospho-beta-D-glucosidase BglC (GH1 family)
MTKKLLLPLLAVSFLFFSVCSTGDDSSGTAKRSVTSVTLKPTTLGLTAGGTGTLTATVMPLNAINTTVTWKSSNEAVATVSGGTVTAVAAGAATITVTTDDGKKTATCAVTVSGSGNPGEIGITLNKSTLALTVGGSETLTATNVPSGATVAWSTSNAAVATVNGGTVSAIAAGTATVTAAAGGKSASCTVTVTTAGNPGGNLTGSAAYFQSKGLHLGWNLGNALDARSTSETAWGNPAITQTLLNGVKTAGFNMVRIPVTWGTGTAPTTDKLTRVAEVVTMAKNAGLVAIINIHHDGDSPTTATGNHWLNINKASSSTAQRTAITNQFKSQWEHIADHFKDYGEELIFEPFNEIHNGDWGSNTISQTESDIINEWNQVFTDVVRASGGNNTNRYLIVKPYCAKLSQARDDRFALPNDPTPNRQIVSFHYYEPQNFALNGSDSSWSVSSNGSLMTRDFSRMKSSFVDKGIAVIIGESGATYQNRSGTAGDTANANRVAYFSHLASTAKANGLTPIYWDNGSISGNGNGEMFGLFNRSTGQPNNTHSRACIEAMVNGVK